MGRVNGHRVLLGPFLTEQEFEERVHAEPGSIRDHAFLLRIDGTIAAGPAYPLFQVSGDTVRTDIAWLVTRLRQSHLGDIAICHWLCGPEPHLGGMTPLDWLDRDWSFERVVQTLPEPRHQREQPPVRTESSPQAA